MILTRFHRPTKMDEAEYGTLWIVTIDDIPEYYTQIGRTTPNWVPLGDFLVASFKHLIYSDTFRNDCLKLFEINMCGENAYTKLYDASQAAFASVFHGSSCGCTQSEMCRCAACTGGN